jgi:hypothetical protein
MFEKIRRIWRLFITIVVIFGFVASIVTIIAWMGINPRISPDPSFDFNYLNQPNDPPVYEVTEGLADPGSAIDLSDICVIATYSGEEYSGPVNIQIKTASGETKTIANWSNFQKSHLDIPLDLAPSDLFEYSGLNFEDLEGKRGEFEIEVAYYDKKWSSEKITVVYTPWLHTTRLSNVAIPANESITACVKVKNFGTPSKFKVVGCLYDATSINTSTLESCSKEWWWPGKTWNSTRYYEVETNAKIDTNGESTVVLNINGSFFEERHIYILETYAEKNLPYLNFPIENGRVNLSERWRVRDQPHYSAIVVLAYE